MSTRRRAIIAGLGGLLLTSAVGKSMAAENEKQNIKNDVLNSYRRDFQRTRKQAQDIMTSTPVLPFDSDLLADSKKIVTSQNIKNIVSGTSCHHVGPYGRGCPQSTRGKMSVEDTFLTHMASIFDARPEVLTAAADRFGIAPGTHLASRFMEAPIPLFLSTSAGWTGHDNPQRGSATYGDGNTSCSLYHHAVYLGDGWTYGYPEGLGTIQKFMGRNKKYYEVAYPHTQDKKEIFRRAIDVIRHKRNKGFQRKYNKITTNCEHMATYIMTGTPASLQVLRAKLVLLGIGALTLARTVQGAAAARKKGVKMMRKWGFKPGMKPHEIDRVHDQKRQKYSIFNHVRGRVPKELSHAKNAALAASKA